jgi:hypothetical protein
MIFVSVGRTQLMAENVLAHARSQAGSTLLVETIVNATIYSRIVNIICDLFPTRVMEHNLGQKGVGEGDGVSILSVHFF